MNCWLFRSLQELFRAAPHIFFLISCRAGGVRVDSDLVLYRGDLKKKQKQKTSNAALQKLFP